MTDAAKTNKENVKKMYLFIFKSFIFLLLLYHSVTISVPQK